MTLLLNPHRPRDVRIYRTKLVFIAATASLLLSSTGFASSLVPQNSHYYYDMGGNSDIHIPPVKRNTILKIGGDIGTNLGYNCDGFNPAVSINNTLNNFEQSLYGLSDSIVGSATALVVGAAWYALEKADPDLYNFLQNDFASAEETFNIGLQSCQDTRKLVQAGKSPYNEFFAISDSKGWIDNSRAAASGQDKDPVVVRTTTAQQQGKNGMPWVHKGQNSGGKGQLPIKVTSDVTKAGYNIIADPTRPLDSSAAPTGDQAALLKRYWNTPDEAAKWSQLVLGDITITAEQSDEAQSTVGGMGLTSLLTSCPAIGHPELTCIQTLQDNLWAIVNTDRLPNPDDLRKVSATNLTITPQVIDAIRNQNDEERALSVQKLAEEVAIQNVAEEGLGLRRLLTVGAQAQPVQSASTLQANIQQTIKRLDSDIQDITFEHDIRQKMMGNTLQTVLKEQDKREINAKASINDESALSLNQGAVYKGRSNN
ncbi:MAG: integrating conjugative element protein [Gammaproteobacteria bacterium]|jgi:integrating conjugative element protein (TIGR03755 family)|nr:integrating conjugative element protein [Gammaproteobacteria bacterium]